MDDYATLVERVCFTLPRVRGCLLLSEDGLLLSAYPDESNSVAQTAWLHFCALGEPLRGFLAFADQVWVYVRHGPYAAFVVAEAGVRPGVLVDQLEQVLTTTRVTLHAGTDRVPGAARAAVPPAGADPPAPFVTPPEAPRDTGTVRPAAKVPSTKGVPDPPEEPADPLPQPAVADGSWRPVPAADRAEDEDGEIDRVQLAQEFSGLLQMHRADDEASS